MPVNMKLIENETINGLIADISGDVLIQFDRNGFILQMSGGLPKLSENMQSSLFPLHITDLATQDYAEFLKRHLTAAVAGCSHDGWAEFPAKNCWAENEHCAEDCLHWYALNVRPLYGAGGEVDGALGVLRSVQHLRTLEGELRTSSEIDPITGLGNRRTFRGHVQRHLNRGGSHVVVFLAIDVMRALRFRYGQHASDEMLWGFATFLKTMAPPEYELACLNNEQFGVLMPNTSRQVAHKWSKDVIETFGRVTKSQSPSLPSLTASAGICPAQFNADWSMREAEIGLLLSRSSGGNQVAFTWTRDAA